MGGHGVAGYTVDRLIAQYHEKLTGATHMQIRRDVGFVRWPSLRTFVSEIIAQNTLTSICRSSQHVFATATVSMNTNKRAKWPSLAAKVGLVGAEGLHSMMFE